VHALETRRHELILSDYSLPGFDGHSALKIAREKCPETPFIFVTGTMGEEVAIETLKSGATDYVLKTRLSRLIPAVNRALREAHERTEHRRAEEQLRQSHAQLRALSVYLQSVREEERTRIAREVHDEHAVVAHRTAQEQRSPPAQRELEARQEARAVVIDAELAGAAAPDRPRRIEDAEALAVLDDARPLIRSRARCQDRVILGLRLVGGRRLGMRS